MEASSSEAEWPVGSVFCCVRRLFLSHPENTSARGRSPLMDDLARANRVLHSAQATKDKPIRLNHFEPGYKIKWISPEKAFSRKFWPLLARSELVVEGPWDRQYLRGSATLNRAVIASANVLRFGVSHSAPVNREHGAPSRAVSVRC